MGAAEIAAEVFASIAAFLMTDDDYGLAADAGKATGHGLVVADAAIAVEFAEIGEGVGDIIQHEWPAGVAGDLDALPGRQVLIDGAARIGEHALHGGDFRGQVDV